MKKIELYTGVIESLKEFEERVEMADTWDEIEADEYKEMLEWVELDYTSYSDPDEMWDDFKEALSNVVEK
ncbi:hypothetical protein [Peptostreptococcus equinus]|uniref:Uncharacterized protein n=1 Tax=Peptostreptococcus equinus TaxID=3003601 RepID=A0ABY7JT11_9FIRM|nr:hypothetical protein [Peptostreptococcus sp. CBA3647]WAW15308.1 hypothetical protein O0R46_02315 [Peptostreptococcus sp. CBA3647]